MFKAYVKFRLQRYVKRFFRAHPEVRLIVVVGAVGKTTTKTAIADVLAERYRVQLEPTNLNDQMAVPLGILGVKYPDYAEVRKLGTWRKVFQACRERVKHSEVQIIVQEVGTDHPGEMKQFARYLRPDLLVITAILPEHMVNFGTMEAVAAEELTLATVSQKVLINVDDTPVEVLQQLDPKHTLVYGFDPEADYRATMQVNNPLEGTKLELTCPQGRLTGQVQLLGEHSVRTALAAAGVGAMLGLEAAALEAGLAKIQPVNGRMNPLDGLKNSTIIDDTYNSSPRAAVAALKTLYEIPTDQRIAVLGNMNELGSYAEAGHQDVAEFLDGTYLDWVVTLGDLANQHIAPIARRHGLNVQTTHTPLEAGAFVNKVLDPDRHSVVLLKGSQDGVYLEEAAKILVEGHEYDKLVRQDEHWRQKKAQLFEKAFANAESDD